MKEYKQTFVVEEAKWKNANSFPEHLPSLYYKHTDGSESCCCLGFVCNQLGVPMEFLLRVGTPSFLMDFEGIPQDISFLVQKDEVGDYESSPLADRAIFVNDDMNTTVEEKKEALINLFHKHGYGLEFK